MDETLYYAGAIILGALAIRFVVLPMIWSAQDRKASGQAAPSIFSHAPAKTPGRQIMDNINEAKWNAAGEHFLAAVGREGARELASSVARAFPPESPASPIVAPQPAPGQ